MRKLLDILSAYDDNAATVNEVIEAVNAAIKEDTRFPSVVAYVRLTIAEEEEFWKLNDSGDLTSYDLAGNEEINAASFSLGGREFVALFYVNEFEGSAEIAYFAVE